VERGNVGGDSVDDVLLSGARGCLTAVGSVVRREEAGAGACIEGGRDETGLVTGAAATGVALNGLSVAVTKLKADLRGELGFEEDCS